MNPSNSENTEKPKSTCKSHLTTLLKISLGVLIVGFVVITILLLVIPAATWTIQVINGEISTRDTFELTIEEVITYAISMLTLLVTVITLGVGFIAVFGYHQIKTDAHDTATETAMKASADIMKETKDTVDERVNSWLSKADNDRRAQENERTKLSEEFGKNIEKIIKKIDNTINGIDKSKTDETDTPCSTSCEDSDILNKQDDEDDVTDNELE